MIESILTDMHTHTIASGHAYSTLLENVNAAAASGLEAIAITEHGPAMPGSVQSIHFHNYATVPRKIKGVYVFCGVELNVLNYDGEVDLSNNMLSRLDFVIASLHGNILKPGTTNDHTETWLNIIENSYIDCLGHPGRGDFEFDLPTVLEACLKNNVAIEVNAKSFEKHCNVPRCEDIVLGCKSHGVPVMVNTDAHFSTDIGQLDSTIDFLNELNFPKELVVNRNLETLMPWLAKRKPWKTDLQDLSQQLAKSRSQP